jgi:hypothetical protein
MTGNEPCKRSKRRAENGCGTQRLKAAKARSKEREVCFCTNVKPACQRALCHILNVSAHPSTPTDIILLPQKENDTLMATPPSMPPEVYAVFCGTTQKIVDGLTGAINSGTAKQGIVRWVNLASEH